MNHARLFIHAGLPRTATTTLQRAVFPKLQKISYLGKPWDNRAKYHDENADPVATVRQLLKTHADDQQKAHELIGQLLSAILKQWKAANQFMRRDAAKNSAQVWANCILEVLNFNKQGKFLLSDESLIESVGGAFQPGGAWLGNPPRAISKNRPVKAFGGQHRLAATGGFHARVIL